MSYRNFLIACVIITLGAVSALAQAGRVLERPAPRYQLQPGDVFEVSFPLTPEFDQSITLQPDGFVTLQAIGELKAGGLTVPELTTMIREKYASILKDPILSIKLTEFEKPFFIAAGELARPGKYDMKSGMTLTEAVALAGGLSKDAKDTQIVVFRRTGAGDIVEVREFNLEKLYSGKSREDLDLHAGDMVFVPERRLSKLKPFLPVAALRLWFDPFSF